LLLTEGDSQGQRYLMTLVTFPSGSSFHDYPFRSEMEGLSEVIPAPLMQRDNHEKRAADISTLHRKTAGHTPSGFRLHFPCDVLSSHSVQVHVAFERLGVVLAQNLAGDYASGDRIVDVQRRPAHIDQRLD